MNLRQALPPQLLRFGAAFKRAYYPNRLPRENISAEFVRLYPQVRPYTMTSWERLYADFQAIEHVVASGIEGAVVECGVWRGGSTMMMAKALQHLGDTSRELYLYDTFAGMTEPSAADGVASHAMWSEGQKGSHNACCYSSLEDVRGNIHSTGYPRDRIHLVEGPVESTIPSAAPPRIAILRLDTDWYESTRHELAHLYPRLSVGGVILIDDYGAWEGARKAVDEYFAEHGPRPLLGRTDPTGRMGIKTQMVP